MTRDPQQFSKTTFDLAVIGGGIQGAAVAREAALRGLKVALVEARDFAAGTSSRSSKLIHGGLRYLEQLDFKLVGEARRERRRLLRLSPHLARPIPFILPIYEDDPYSRLKIRFGLALYDLLGNLGKNDRHRMVTAEEALRLVPALRPEGLRAAALYYDSCTDDARLTLENVLDAARHGAVVANHLAVRALETRGIDDEPRVVTAQIEDRLSGKCYSLEAHSWVNAAGPWVDQVRALVPGYDGSKTLRLTKGTHLIVPAVTGPYALLAAILPGDRVFLMVPWHGHALLGTTDTDFEGDPATVRPDRDDREYLLKAANRVFRNTLRPDDVIGSFAGLRALVRQEGRSPSGTTREYRFHKDPWAKNFISICGGKLTTARALGEKLVDEIQARVGASLANASGSAGSPHPSRRLPLPGGGTGPFDAFLKSATAEASREFALDASICERVVRTYGSRWREVLEPVRHDHRLRELLPGSPPVATAEVDFAIRQEMAMSPEDFLLRRSGLNWLACSALREAAPSVTAIFAERFAWSAERRAAALEEFCRLTAPT